MVYKLKLISTSMGISTHGQQRISENASALYGAHVMQNLWNRNRNQFLLVNFKTPLERAIEWIEYHSGAYEQHARKNFKYFSSSI